MARITVVEMYPVMIQARDAMKFKDKTSGQTIEREAQKEREAMCIVADYNEFRVPFILPEHFDHKHYKVEVGASLDITCQALEQLAPMNIKNVNRVFPASPKK